ADVARFGQRRGVGHRERHVQHAGERLRQQGFSATRRSDQHDVRLGDLDLVRLAAVTESLVVIMHCHRKNPLGLVLTDHVVVQDLTDLLRRRHAVLGLHQGGLALLPDDIHAKLDAFIANEHGRAGDQLPDLMLALAAEAAIEGIAGIAPGFGGWHVCNAPPLGELATPASPHTRPYVKRGSLMATTSKYGGRPANRDQLVAALLRKQPLGWLEWAGSPGRRRSGRTPWLPVARRTC